MPTLAPYDLTSHCLFAGFIKDEPTFVGSDGSIAFFGARHRVIEAHQGIASVAAAEDNSFLVTGGEDGKVIKTLSDGTTTQLAENGRKWMTAIATGPHGAFAFAASKTAWADDGTGKQALREFNHERSVEGLAFAPKGLRFAVARYNGVTLHWLNGDAKPLELEWKGAHHSVIFSPDNRYVITAMQENALHGWRLADNQHLRMSGYPAKVKSWSWSPKGKWLATSGAAAAIVWPFQSKDGPMGKAPLELGTRGSNLVTCVSCHPQEDMVAVGFDDGMILFVRFEDAKEILLRRPGKGAISAMNWDKSGHRLAFGSAEGEAGLIDISA